MRELLAPHQAIRYRADDFLALWRMDEASGNLVDVTGSYTASVTTGLVGAAGGLFSSPEGTTGSRTFSASRATATGDSTARTALLGEWTISAWVRVTAIGVSQYFMAYAGTNQLAAIGLNSAGNIFATWRIVATSTNVVVTTTGPALVAGQVYHVAAVKEKDPANAGKYRVRLYVDGERRAFASNLTTADSGSTSPQWNIGTDGAGNQALGGSIDDLAVLKYAASEEMVRDIWERGISPFDAATLATADTRQTLTRVWVETADDTRVNLCDLYGQDFLRSVTISDDVDDQGQTASIELAREVYALSLSPFVTSAPNTDSSTLLKINRRVLVEVATVPTGTLPGSLLPWDLVFDGFIEGIDWGGETIRLDVFDRMLALQDVWIEPNRTKTPPEDYTYGSNTGTLDVEDEMQAVIDNQEPPTVGYVGRKPSLYTPTSPAWALNLTSTTSTDSVAGQLQRWADQIGWLVKYRWDDYRKQFRLTFFEPERTKVWSASDPTIEAWQVLEVTKAEIRRDEIRNVCEVEYGDSSTPDDDEGKYTRQIKIASDATSITKYGRKYVRLGIGSTQEINVGTDAQKLADAVVADLKEPKAHLELRTQLLTHIEVGDVVSVKADGRYFDADQTFAVVSLRHNLEDNKRTSTFSLRAAAPVGRRFRWFDMMQTSGRVPGVPLGPILAPSGFAIDEVLEGVRIKWDPPINNGNRRYLETAIHRSSTSGFTPSSSTLLATVRGKSSAVFPHDPGVTQYYKIVHRDDTGQRSAVSSQLSKVGRRATKDTLPTQWRTAFHVRQATAQTINLAATWAETKIANLTTSDVNEGTVYSTVNTKFTAPADGVYLVFFGVGIDRIAGDQLAVRLYKNAAATDYRAGFLPGIGDITGSWVVSLVTSDTLELYMTGDLTKSVNIQLQASRTFFGATFLFAT